MVLSVRPDDEYEAISPSPGEQPDPTIQPPALPPDIPDTRSKSHTLRIVLLIVLIVLAVLGTGSYFAVRAIVRGVGAVKTDGAVVGDSILGKMRDAAYLDIYNQAAPEFRDAVTREKFMNLMSTVDATVGKPRAWELQGVQKRAFVGTGGPQNTTEYSYHVTHERGTSNVTITVDRERRLLYLNFNFGQ